MDITYLSLLRNKEKRKMVWIKCQKCGFNIGNLTKKDTIRCCKCSFENSNSKKEEKKKDETTE